MKTSPFTILDPMTTVAPYPLLKKAAYIVENEPVKAYWEKVKTPVKVTGTLPFEFFRMVLVFLLPAMILYFAKSIFGTEGFVYSIIVALTIFKILNLRFWRAVEKQKSEEYETWDRGRYAVTKLLAAELGCKPADITLEVIYVMYSHYQRITEEMQHEANAKAARKATYRKEGEDARHRQRSTLPQSTDDWDYTTSTVSHEHGANWSDDEHFTTENALFTSEMFSTQTSVFTDWPTTDYHCSFNPANGLPMMDGGAIDVMGNPYGTDTHHF